MDASHALTVWDGTASIVGVAAAVQVLEVGRGNVVSQVDILYSLTMMHWDGWHPPGMAGAHPGVRGGSLELSTLRTHLTLPDTGGERERLLPHVGVADGRRD